MSYYQTQDKVDQKVVQKFTADCKTKNCKISARIGETTLLAPNDYYDSEGRLIINDPNKTTVTFYCISCGRKEKVQT